MTGPKPTSPKRPKRQDSEANALREFLESVGSYTTDLIFGVPEGKRLYHYTDLNGLQGIISNQDLWLTDSRYSNDSEEMRTGYGVAHDVLDRKRLQAAAGNDHDSIAFLDSLSQLLATPPAEAVYIGCFCLEGNLLSQWRGYAANGTGVSLEFDPPRFAYMTGPDSPPKGLMRLWKVFYDSTTQTNIMTDAIQFASARTGSVEERAKYAADSIFFFVPTFKHHDFHQEDECRLIFTPLPDCTVSPRFRVSRGMLVPYYSVNDLTNGSFRLPIKRIVVGPSPHKDINVASVRAMLAAYGYDDVPVEGSDTPFRA
jgi:hypothetical protein